MATASVVDNLAVYVAQDCTGATDAFKNFYEETLFHILQFYNDLFFNMFSSFQCTKKTSWVSVRRRRARLPPTHPARAGSRSSSWCRFGWEERLSTPPTSNVSRFLRLLIRVKGFGRKKTPLPSVPELTFQTIVSSRTSCSWTAVSESSGGNPNILCISSASKVRTESLLCSVFLKVFHLKKHL